MYYCGRYVVFRSVSVLFTKVLSFTNVVDVTKPRAPLTVHCTETKDTHAEAKSGDNGEPAADHTYAKAPPEEKKKRIKLQGLWEAGMSHYC